MTDPHPDTGSRFQAASIMQEANGIFEQDIERMKRLVQDYSRGKGRISAGQAVMEFNAIRIEAVVAGAIVRLTSNIKGEEAAPDKVKDLLNEFSGYLRERKTDVPAAMKLRFDEALKTASEWYTDQILCHANTPFWASVREDLFDKKTPRGLLPRRAKTLRTIHDIPRDLWLQFKLAFGFGVAGYISAVTGFMLAAGQPSFAGLVGGILCLGTAVSGVAAYNANENAPIAIKPEELLPIGNRLDDILRDTPQPGR